METRLAPFLGTQARPASVLLSESAIAQLLRLASHEEISMGKDEPEFPPNESSLSRRLRQAFGPKSDPEVTLPDTALESADAEGDATEAPAGLPAPPSESASGKSEAVPTNRGGKNPSTQPEDAPVEGRYELRGLLGQGGMGQVLRVFDRDLRRTLAMKVLLASKARKTDPEPDATRSLGRFLEEAQITSQLDHPGVVPVHELGVDAAGSVFFTMRMVRGSSFKEVLAKVAQGDDGWNLPRAVSVLLRVCETMAFAHDKGVTHRDIKPANIMVGRYGQVYVMDWGLARVKGRPDARDIRLRQGDMAFASIEVGLMDSSSQATDAPLMTMDGTVVGTPYFMPPEQAEGDIERVGPASDVYAMGAMLYNLLAGAMPYHRPGTRPSPHAILAQVLQGPPTPLSQSAPEAPPELVAICEKAMARSIDQRYPDMASMAADLRSYLEGRVVRAYESGAFARARKWVRRNRALASSAALILLLSLLGSGSFSVVLAKKNKDLQRANASARANEQNALEHAREAWLETQRADELALASARERERVLGLSDAKRLQSLLASAEQLWPASPSKIATIEAWLHQAARLGERLSVHRSNLEELRMHARPWSAEERAHDLAQRNAERELELYVWNVHRTWLESNIPDKVDAHMIMMRREGQSPQEQLQRVVAKIQQLEAESAHPEAHLSRASWSFETTENAWYHEQLSNLVSGLEYELMLPREGKLEEVQRLLEFTIALDERSRTSPKAQERWRTAIAAIAESTRYSRDDSDPLVLSPQEGLLPLGPDPASGLWEFAHLPTGVAPVRDPESGRLQMDRECGLVLVLIPRGTFLIGCQSNNPQQPNYDPMVDTNAYPVQKVTLTEFFISKFEMTQFQWLRVTHMNPSNYQAGSDSLNRTRITGTHPVEMVAWNDATDLARRVGLELPTEAQWERACRAGTDWRWSSGDSVESLRYSANLADAGTRAFMLEIDPRWEFDPELDDGFYTTSPVGSFEPNGFGLHDMHGNVAEWCRDRHFRYADSKARPGDGLREGEFANAGEDRIYRGGSFFYRADSAKSARRNWAGPSNSEQTIGFRPARAIEQ